MEKILIINSSSTISGAEISLISVIEVLKKKYSITLILPSKGELYDKLYKEIDVKIFDLLIVKKNHNFLQILLSAYYFLEVSLKISSLVRKEGFHCIYFNSTKAAIYSFVIKILTRKRTVWHVRDNLTDLKYLAILIGLFSDKIICISSHIYNQLGFVSKKTIIYNGIDTEAWKMNPYKRTFFKKELRLDEGRVLIAQIGQLIPWKNPNVLIEVAKKVIVTNKNAYFLLIGRDTFNSFSSYNLDLKNAILENGLEGFFSIMDFTDNIIEYISEIDILIHLATREPFGRVLIEAMALKKPIVALNSGAAPEIISHRESGLLINSLNPDYIAKELTNLINDAELRKRYGICGRKIVKSRFDIRNLEHIKDALSFIR